ncbi:hypothetical protein ASPZODRAFT_16181 [Penicilliopsis zonata CBS 506.65]|uniref:Carrier domain-containing protein n=1 Tax=Penicilliopsis zonata CBS 506.65 TaxID=1073090 RepID=A0A1L9SH64_9EURO|nr:hypothetical protein ASPZODRAFT_16181 [Penicilliopsis zonata CBS 506.65]OJJ46414.1 hypothetical protein ASPZODRAFT_16181 [Penicilliopsis zonata CBS 506.65]
MASQLLPAILDHRAQSDPDRVYAKYPVSPTSYAHGFHTVSYRQMRHAVDRVTWLLVDTLGTCAAGQFETLAFLGPNDLRYHIVFFAAIKAGYKAFLPSPRNSLVAQKHLLARLECRVLVTVDPEPPFVSALLREVTLQTVRMPSLDTLFNINVESVTPYPYTKSFQEARDDPVLVLHTSGSTGIPKPMIYTNEFIWRINKANTLPAPEGMSRVDDLFLSGEFFSVLPAFHIAGVGWGIVLPLFADSVPVLPLPSRPPSTDGFLEAVRYGSFSWAFLLPLMVEELSRDPEALQLVCTKLTHLFYTGGALPPAAGEVVSTRIPLFSGLGSSECAAFPQIRNPDHPVTETWRYLHFHPAACSEFRHCMDDLYEFVILKSPDSPEAQPVFAMFPALEEYETRDLFTPHPSLPGLWRHRGRLDDIVVFLNGEKTNPISFENEVSRHPAVRTALVAGNQRVEACLLVEPLETSDSPRAVIESVWPTVEAANLQCPAHARVSKSKILIVDAEKPMVRAAKGTVQREATLRLYAAEIDALYSETAVEKQAAMSFSSLEEVLSALHSLVADTTGWLQFQDDMDFFTLGMDSLQTLQLSATIRSKLGISITANDIYRNPSVTLLARHIYRQASGPVDIESRTQAITRVLQHYEEQIDQLASNTPTNVVHPKTPPTVQVVVLTGSTGTVGSFLLDQLLKKTDVSHVYCLNRAQDSGLLQVSRNRERDLPDSFPSNRVTFLTADLTEPSLGLDKATFCTLLDRTTQIIHCAWPVNFNQPLAFFQPSLQGVTGLISFTLQAKMSPSLLFLSSISAVSSFVKPESDGESLLPEAVIPDPACPAHMGYGESKYVAERLLEYASTKLPSLRGGVSRIGQVAGTAQNPRGWSRAEWLPSLIVSSRYVNALPDSLGRRGGQMDVVDWVPVDELASILVELSSSLSLTSSTGTLRVFNCVNPRSIPWSDLISIIVEELTSTGGSSIGTISFQEWLARLQSSSGSVDADALRQNPAVKLLEFYQQLLEDNQTRDPVRLSTVHTARVSPSLACLQPIQAEWMRGWIREWV